MHCKRQTIKEQEFYIYKGFLPGSVLLKPQDNVVSFETAPVPTYFSLAIFSHTDCINNIRQFSALWPFFFSQSFFNGCLLSLVKCPSGTSQQIGQNLMSRESFHSPCSPWLPTTAAHFVKLRKGIFCCIFRNIFY